MPGMRAGPSETTPLDTSDSATAQQRKSGLSVALQGDSGQISAETARELIVGAYWMGWLAASAYIKRTEHQLVRALERSSTVWSVRGQRRTSGTFADPHPADFPGRGAA